MTTLAELKKRVGWRTGRDVAPEALTSYVNEALETLAAERDWPWLQRTVTFTTVDGQDTYTVPWDYARTRSLQVNGEEVDYLHVRDLENGDSGFVVEGDRILLRPTPRSSTTTYTHRYQRSPSALVNDGDEAQLPGAFSSAVVAYAAYLVYARMGGVAQWERAAERALDDYRGWVKRLVNERRHTGPHRIRTRPGGGV